ncbi:MULTISPECIES: hypothetical protein [unclassified Variovorax]|uniref:hypothetical protein n=1 Tax=unclassified Variovorax TaxID=663243 RepID=UPI003F46E8C6
MDVLTFISKLVEALAWPAIVVWLLWYLKEHLPALARSLRKLKFSGLEMEFEKQAEQLAAETQTAIPATPPFEDPDIARLRQIGEISPRAAIVEAWVRVETNAAEVVRQAGLHMPNAVGPLQLLNSLKQLDVLTAPQVNAFRHLRELRNMAVHAVDMDVTPEAVNQYIVSAVAMAGYLEDMAEFVKNKKAV